ELEAFAAFASDLDRASRAQLERGVRLVELLKQPNYTPYPIETEVIAVWLGTSGSIDDIPVSDVRRFEQEFLENLRHSRKELVASSRIAKAQERVAAARPYANAITDVLNALARNAGGVEHPLLTPRPRVNRVGVVIITSDRGLCGAYNANVLRTAERLVDSL